jgi:hypothetical protein
VSFEGLDEGSHAGVVRVGKVAFCLSPALYTPHNEERRFSNLRLEKEEGGGRTERRLMFVIL